MPLEDVTAVIADDHELFRVALAELLARHHGFGRVVAVASFDEALDCLGREAGARLALFDLVMPGMGEPGCLEAVRRAFPEVRVVVVSGSERREDILAALAAGVHGYIPKTLRLAAIGAALRAVLQGEVYVPASLATLPPEPVQELIPGPNEGPNQGPIQVPAAGPLAERQGLGPRPASLTARQRDVLVLLRQGRSNKEIARALGLGSGTVKVHVAGILRALGVASRTGVAAALSESPGPAAREDRPQ